MSRDDERRANDPKTWTERASAARDLRYAVALDRIDDLTRVITTSSPGYTLATRIQTILKEES